MRRKCALWAAATVGLTGACALGQALVPGDIMVYQVGNAGTATSSTAGTPLVLLEINPITNTVDQTFNTPLFATNEGSEGDLSLSNDGTEVLFTGWTSTDGDTATLSQTNTPRAVGMINLAGVFNQPASFTLSSTPTATDQVRSAATLDDTNFYFADKTGIYYSNTNTATGSTAQNAANLRGIKAFGGTLYGLQQSTTAAVISSVTLTGNSVSAVTALPELPADNNAQDFIMLPSVPNGSTFDTLYTLDTGKKTAAINKYTFNGSAWSADGSPVSLNSNVASGSFDAAQGLGAQIGAGGNVDLFVTVDPSGSDPFVMELLDSGGISGALNVAVPSTMAAADILYTAPTSGDLLNGVVAVPEPASLSLLFLGSLPLLARRRR